jgi:hypothetical protein
VGRDEAPAPAVVAPQVIAPDKPLELIERLLRLRFHFGEERKIAA